MFAFNHTSTKEIKESYHHYKNLKIMLYLLITITKRFSKLYKANYNKTCQEIKDLERWSTYPFDFNSLTLRLATIKVNVRTTKTSNCFILYLWRSRKPNL